jgi:hypothetical protein
MTNEELLKNINDGFNEIVPGAGSTAIKAAINNVTRSINRLQIDDREINLRLRKISTDLMKTFTNQVQYSELKNKAENPGVKVKTEFDDSFFESLAILKKELFESINKI